ncbi:hypothetical protein Anapl_03145 [Anas platyrhynchos]|uniref:Uncharacterized protein n=1 Tax=Anas platyrhynchos TaxID=8839 RepID=R0K8V5_ANAPL|nr:hypothetical protein Anapl_03145 [Anas platyrhynchos]
MEHCMEAAAPGVGLLMPKESPGLSWGAQERLWGPRRCHLPPACWPCLLLLPFPPHALGYRRSPWICSRFSHFAGSSARQLPTTRYLVNKDEDGEESQGWAWDQVDFSLLLCPSVIQMTQELPVPCSQAWIPPCSSSYTHT